jgi:hypothetical protein
VETVVIFCFFNVLPIKLSKMFLISPLFFLEGKYSWGNFVFFESLKTWTTGGWQKMAQVQKH